MVGEELPVHMEQQVAPVSLKIVGPLDDAPESLGERGQDGLANPELFLDRGAHLLEEVLLVAIALDVEHDGTKAVAVALFLQPLQKNCLPHAPKRQHEDVAPLLEVVPELLRFPVPIEAIHIPSARRCTTKL